MLLGIVEIGHLFLFDRISKTLIEGFSQFNLILSVKIQENSELSRNIHKLF